MLYYRNVITGPARRPLPWFSEDLKAAINNQKINLPVEGLAEPPCALRPDKLGTEFDEWLATPLRIFSVDDVNVTFVSDSTYLSSTHDHVSKSKLIFVIRTRIVQQYRLDNINISPVGLELPIRTTKLSAARWNEPIYYGFRFGPGWAQDTPGSGGIRGYLRSVTTTTFAAFTSATEEDGGGCHDEKA